MPLNLSSLMKAINSLEKSLHVANDQEKMSKLDIDQKDTIRAGVIQNFETAYELCWKFMKRWIEENVDANSVDGVTRRELYRISAEHKLINSVDEWMLYHTSRNLTSHLYDSEIAEEAFKTANHFLPVAQELLERIKAHND